ncbi:hypothetical protein P8935_11685 [Telmatobacter sp. DSM 110680]|uniref:Uncharacterized protein n=1 Tax=Telmatobacter sp. DSM 110680 TaxID=3036704 RepID=A0AAU7DSD4_9BACT
MRIEAPFPQTAKEMLAVIVAAERSRKYVWTAGRVLIESGCVGRWQALDSNAKKTLLKSLTKLLEELSDQGALALRPDLQGIGFGQEKGFDYIRPRHVQLNHDSG